MSEEQKDDLSGAPPIVEKSRGSCVKLFWRQAGPCQADNRGGYKRKEKKMPIYVYQTAESGRSCSRCSEAFEVFQAISEPPLTNCVHCNAPIRRIIQPVGFKMGKKHLLTEANMKRHGFSKLVNEGEGKFKKVV